MGGVPEHGAKPPGDWPPRIPTIFLRSPAYEEVADGKKTIECRINSPIFQKVNVGDEIEVMHTGTNTGTIEKIKKIVKAKETFQKLDEMLTHYIQNGKLKDILPTAKDLKDGMAIYEQWFTPDRMKEYNIVSFTMEDPSGHQKSSKSHKSSRPHKSGGPHKADGGRARAKSKARAKSRSRSRSRSKRSNSKSKSKI